MEGVKRCSICRVTKPLSSFCKAKHNPRGVRCECKECQKQQALIYYSKFRDARLAYSKEYRAKNRKRTMLSHARQRSEKFGIKFSLTEDDFEIPEVCPALGIKMEFSSKGRVSNPSLDRLDPELGYVPGNVRVISSLANRIKSNATAKQILMVGLWLAEQHGQPWKDQA